MQIGTKMENLLDRRLERLAFELFTAQGHHPKTVQFKIKELKICAEQGYNSRAQLITLVKTAMVAA
jgi:hypothetical protein